MHVRHGTPTEMTAAHPLPIGRGEGELVACGSIRIQWPLEASSFPRPVPIRRLEGGGAPARRMPGVGRVGKAAFAQAFA